MRQLFDAMDIDFDGHLTKNEIIQGLMRMGMSKAQAIEEATRIFTLADIDENGYLEFNEWCTTTMDKRQMLKRPMLLQAFKMIDKDGSGVVSFDEVRDIVIGDTSEENDDIFRQMLRDIDIDADGKMDFKEFEKMMAIIANSKKV